MREIKFRGKSNDEWVYGMLSKVNEGDTEHGEPFEYKIQTDEKSCGEYDKYFITDKETIGQFTGLHDKNRKEIYEGDVVHISDDWEEYGWASGENYSIDFKEGRFRLKPKYKPNAIGYDLENADELEVIGNIYENSDLLKD